MATAGVVLHPRHPPGVETVLQGMADVDLITPVDDRGVARALDSGVEVLVTYTWREEFLTPHLRWVAGTGAGFEQYPTDAFRRDGVVLTTGRGVHARCVAEHAFALLLALTRGTATAVRNMAAARWQKIHGEELAGKNLLIVGLGQIGEEFARRTHGWGMSRAGVKRDQSVYDGCVPVARGTDYLREMCAWADIVVLTAPASVETYHLIGRPELALLGSGWLVNVGRGPLVDEDALVEALVAGQLRGAGLDVVETEPLPAESPLWALPQVVLSGHSAGDSPGYGPRWAKLFRQNLRAFHGEGAWSNRVDLVQKRVTT